MTDGVTGAAPCRFDSAAEGIAAEVAMLAQVAATGQPARLLWQARVPAIVLPAACLRRPGFAAAAGRAAAAGWPLLARPTGGGPVPQGPGVLNLALVFPAEAGLTLEAGYRRICAPLTAAFARLGLTVSAGATGGSFCDGAWNLSLAGRKIVGTAQRWQRRDGGWAVLVHALILIDPPLAAVVPVIDRLHRDLEFGTRVLPDAHTSLRAERPDLGVPDFIRALGEEDTDGSPAPAQGRAA